MAITSFKRTAPVAPVVDAEVVPDTNPSTAMVAAPKAGVPDVARPSYAGVEGEFKSSDAAIPYIAIGQKAGTLCDDHPDWMGQFVFDKALPLSSSIKFLVLTMRKFYEEVVEYGSDEIPQRFETAAAARAANVEFRDAATIDILVEIPADQAENFAIIDHDGKFYAAARWGVRSTAYGKTVGIIFRDLATWLKGNPRNGFYTATTEKKSNGKNTWWVPSLKAAGPVPDGLRAAIEEQFGS